MTLTKYYAKYKTTDGKEHFVEIFRFSKSMIGKPLWVEARFGVSCEDLIVAKTDDDFTNRGWYKVIAIFKEQTTVRTTKVY